VTKIEIAVILVISYKTTKHHYGDMASLVKTLIIV